MNNIHPTAVIEKSAEIADNVVIGPNCYIDAGTIIGPGCVLDANVVIGRNIKIGRDNLFYAGCVVGRNPQMLGAGLDTVFGRLEIGNSNTIREHATIHPSIYPDGVTKIGDDNMIMIGVHIGHDCVIEDKVVISNNTQVSGHCNIQTGVWLSGTVQIHQFVTIGMWSYAAGFAGLNRDVPPFVIVSGHYPPEIRAVNKRGLLRAGFDQSRQEQILRAFKKLFRNDGVLLENTRAVMADEDMDENARAMAQAIINSSKHRYGRYLETFRK